jgi:hypothetical protein
VCDYCCHHDISKSKGVVIDFSQLKLIDSSEELLFYFFLDGGGNGEFLDDSIM